MSIRESAVVDALWVEGGHTGATPKALYRKTARAALRASDSVTFSQARLEAMAKELHGSARFDAEDAQEYKPWPEKGCLPCRERAGVLAGILRGDS